MKRFCEYCGKEAGYFADSAWIKAHKHCERIECINNCKELNETLNKLTGKDWLRTRDGFLIQRIICDQYSNGVIYESY